MTKVVRIQEGHYPRKTGSTGAYNAELKIAEQDQNRLLGREIKRLFELRPVSGMKLEFIEADERPYRACDMFISLHMDGNNSSAPKGPSVGYPPGSKESIAFTKIWKRRRDAIPGAVEHRPDIYTNGLKYFYGYKAAYSHYAKVKCVIENGFVTNHAEARWAQANRTEVANGILDSIAEYYGLTRKPSAKGGVVLLPTTEAVATKLTDAWKNIEHATGNSYSAKVELWQRMLNRDGAELKSDGLVGPKTEAAHRAWCDAEGSVVRARPGKFQWRKMLNRVSLTHADATAMDMDVLNNALTSVNARNAQLTAGLVSRDAEIASLKNGLESALQKIRWREATIAELNSEVDSLREAADDIPEDVRSDLNKIVTDLEDLLS